MNDNNYGVVMQISDPETGDAVSVPMPLYGVNWPGGSIFSDTENSPRYVTIWAFNYPGDADYTTDPDDFSRSGTSDFDTEVKFYIDNVTMYGMNHYHNNASINDNNVGGGAVDITATAT